ncbi:MAG: 3'-5' exonuclease [Planctomycetota bacterium]
MSNPPVRYLVFDVEAVGDGALVSRVKYPGEGLSPDAALDRYRGELLETKGSDVLAPTWVVPCAVAVAKVADDFSLLDVVALDEPEYRPEHIARDFWLGWQHYRRPTFVTFNGRGYDLPVMEFCAFRYGLSLPGWFNTQAKSFEQNRHRYNQSAHLDLMDLLSNFGAMRMTGGLNLLANLIGKPGKTGIDGSQVQGLFDAGESAAINDYCRCDVLDTYFVFLRTRVVVGELTLEREQELVEAAHAWLTDRREERPAYAEYLDHWGDWDKPDFTETS